MNKNYNHLEVEKDIEKKWRDKKYFITHNKKIKPFTILLPPPNVTGKLHLGHALDVYIPDTIIRYKKLKGYDVMWIPGMDHAGIATQSKVEDVIYKQTGQTRHDLGREKFLEQVWAWKDEYANLFRKQWARVGLALDYENERFTLDKDASNAVQSVFIKLYEKGYIYRGVKAVHWDIQLQTAISNIEVINEPTTQIMYYIKYKVFETNEDLIVATVRPETLLSDIAIVYNPMDQKYKKYKNLHVVHPLTQKVLPIIEDEYVDPDFGTGLMKLSAHADADIEIIQKLGLEIIESIDKNGFINYPNTKFHGLERFQARIEIAKYLEEHNFIFKKEEVTSNVSISDRSKSVTEILVLPQWFVKMDDLKDLIIKNMKSKDQVKFYPKRLKHTMQQWMDKIHDWNISRQIWWGHRIPAWYKENQIKVQVDSPGEGWKQDEDVLDTWFSSGIAPFTFMGWPNNTKMLERYYPTSLLVTGYDIIFFWVARMYFMGLEFMKQKPFKELLFHGLIRDEKGQKMSKSLNNGVDPMDLIDQYGSDSLRWFLLTNTSPGMDIRFSTQKVESAWRLNNKLWNIANYIQSLPDNPSKEKTPYDYWILDKLANLSKKITKLIKQYEFAIIGSEIYKFVFNYLSSWYIEFLKSTQNKQVALNILSKTLIVLHPFLPFITDRLYSEIYQAELLEQKMPMLRSYDFVSSIDEVIELVTALRKYRDDMQISKKDLLEYWYSGKIEPKWIEIINRMANAKLTQNDDYLISINKESLFIKQSSELKNKNKLELIEKIKYLESEVKRSQNILANQRFVQAAPPEKVEAERLKLDKYTSELNKYMEELKCKY